MLPVASRRRLSGADAFAAVLDHAIRSEGLPGFHALILLRLAARPDLDALRATLAADTPLVRTLRAPCRRALPFGALTWDGTRLGPPPRVDELAAPPFGEAEPWCSLLNATLRPERGENVRFTAFPVPGDGWRVAFLFSHVLADAKAAERLLVHLSRGGGDGAWPAARALLGDARWFDVAGKARAHVHGIDATGGARTRSLAADDADEPSGFAARQVELDPDTTRAAVSRGRATAGYAMEGLWYLACALAALRELDASPLPPGARYVVPLPTSLDRKGEARTFGNHLVFLFLGEDAERAGDPAATARRLRDGMLDHLRARSDLGSQALMETCRPLPLALHGRLARRASGGGFGSLFFTNPGPVAPELTSFCGAEVLGVTHVPLPTPDPGICAATWTFRDRLHLGLTWVRGRWSDERAASFLARWHGHVVGGAA